MSWTETPRIGVDLGGTKIAGVVLTSDGSELARHRTPSPQHDYQATIAAIADLVRGLTVSAGGPATVGIGIPGSISPKSGLVQNANSTWLNGKPLKSDLEIQLKMSVRIANDANCFAMSEAVDGAGQGARSVFGVILGTGCGGGLVLDGKLVDGPRGIGGEWGHNPLPWAGVTEHPGRRCWCGRLGCMETWVSGPALAVDHNAGHATALSPEDISALAKAGEPVARATLARHASRLARGLAHIVNVIDPEVIVLGGGLSNLLHLYDEVPVLMAPYIFADEPEVKIVRPRWGDDSGVRGAARLWP